MLNPDKPLVSIIIPVYNGSNFLRQAIDSALRQTYDNVEVIVVNDGSTDNGLTESIALSYGDRIRYIQKENGGVSTALNWGIQHMKGAYFSWLSHDDVYEPDKIAHQVPYAKEDTVVMCGRRLVDADLAPLPDARDVLRFKDKCTLDGAQAFIELLHQGCFNGCSLLIPKSAFDRCGGFDTELRYCQDLLMWMRLFLSGMQLTFVPEKDVLSRVHGAQQTGRADQRYHQDCLQICRLLLADIARQSTKDKNLLFAFAKYNAVYCTPQVVNMCLHIDAQTHVIGWRQRLWLRLIGFYGYVRPLIRRAYHYFSKAFR